MKKYIDFNTEKRTNAVNSFEKIFFKLVINSVHGKTIENLQKRINVRLVNNETGFLKYTLIIKHFDAELLMTDIDSLTYELKSEDVYEEFFKHKHLFDFSNSPKDSKFFDQANKKVIGKMKDKSEGKVIDESVGLKSKMHSMKNIDGKESNTAKGMNIATEFNEIKDTLSNKKIIRHKMRRIQVKKHKMGSYEIDKISLSVFDDKRFVLNDGIDLLAYFHKDLKNHRQEDILRDHYK